MTAAVPDPCPIRNATCTPAPQLNAILLALGLAVEFRYVRRAKATANVNV